MKAAIPINNLYHMLCYAWDVLPQSNLVNVNLTGKEQPIELLAHIINTGTQHLLRRGIDKGYVNVEEVVTTLRGRVDFAYSGRRTLLHQGRALCSFDELTADILPNQILKATLFRLSRLRGLNKSLQKESGGLLKKFDEVTQIPLGSSLFKRVNFHSNNRFYRFIINVCELVYYESLLDERHGDFTFRDFYRDEGQMPKLYEKFIYHFYRKKQNEYRVSSERIRWDATSDDDPGLSFLPSMLTDITLRSKQRSLIIDAKYYRKTLSSFYGAKRIHSNNLYQINAYLQNVKRNGGNDSEATGMLLYPVVSEHVAKTYTISGKRIRIETVDLAEDWRIIEARLLLLLH